MLINHLSLLLRKVLDHCTLMVAVQEVELIETKKKYRMIFHDVSVIYIFNLHALIILINSMFYILCVLLC